MTLLQLDYLIYGFGICMMTLTTDMMILTIEIDLAEPH